MAKGEAPRPGEWVLLGYRLPREPSTPRITVWRKLKRLGVVQLSDGMVALPADARTREHLEWIAEQVIEAGGESSIWLAEPATAGQERELAQRMAAARADEYAEIIAEARSVDGAGIRERRRLADRLRAELRRIGRRDYFPPPERDAAHAAVHALHEAATTDTATTDTATTDTATTDTATTDTATTEEAQA